MTAIRAVAETHVGYVRTNNEDLAVVSSDLAAVADGMGGHLGGEVAARTAIEELVDAFRSDRSSRGLVNAVEKANQAIWRRSRVERDLHGMGTTLTAAALVGGDDASHLTLVNVGDSRAYKLDRSASRPRISRLTEDHSVVEEMVRNGELSPGEAAVHPHRHVLTRALGIDADVDIDVWDLDVSPGTRLLLCSDGLSDDVPEAEIGAVLAEPDDPRDAARELVGRALAHGGMDNVTVVVIDVVEELAPDEEQPFEMIPSSTHLPDSGADRERADVTQALPVTADKPVESAADEPPSGNTTKTMVARARPVEFYDAELDVADPELVEAAGLLPATGEPEQETAPRLVEPTPDHKRRPGRTMTVRASAAGSVLAGRRRSSGDVTGPHQRATVLVPARGLAKQYRDRVVTLRVVIFLVVLAGLLGGVIAVVIWFQRSSYYVGLDGNRVSIYQGRPGGLLWFKPQLLETSNVTTKDLLPNSVDEVRKGIAESSYPAARQQLRDLSKLSFELGLASGPLSRSSAASPVASTSTTTTTTAQAQAFFVPLAQKSRGISLGPREETRVR